MESSHPILPKPCATIDYASPTYASYPPAPRRWSGQAPSSQSRGGYISPDPSPIAEAPFIVPSMSESEQALRRFDYFGLQPTQHIQPGHAGGGQHEAGEVIRRHSDASHKYPQYVDPYYEQMRRAAMGYKNLQVQEVDPFYYPVMPQRPKSVSGNQIKKGKGRKVDGKQPTFLTKLYQILEQPEYAHIIRWDEIGEVIIIEKPEELAEKILPLIYRQSRFASFSRQLNIYGFMRKVSLRHVDRGICDPDASTWSHPFLRRSSTAAEVQAFKRRVPPRLSQSQRRRTSSMSSYCDDQGGYGLSPTSSEGSYQSPPDAYQQHLLGDVEEEKPTVFPSQPSQHYNTSSPESGGDYPMHIGARPISQQNIHFAAPPLPATIASSSTSYLHRESGIPGGIPASAPAHITSFPTTMHIAQGHIRTRSVQGEPPTATLCSPVTPMGPPDLPAWHIDQMQRPVKEDGAQPTYQVDDPSTWMRRGYTDLNSGVPVNPPLYRSQEPPALQPRHEGPAQCVSPTDPTGSSASFSHLPPIASDTVSPGVYQTGFVLPAYRPFVPIPPRIVPSRSERRGSISSSPYSPRSRPAPPLSIGPIRSIQRQDNETTWNRDIESTGGPDEALPSAGVRGLHRGPFDTMLPESDEMV